MKLNETGFDQVWGTLLKYAFFSALMIDFDAFQAKSQKFRQQISQPSNQSANQ